MLTSAFPQSVTRFFNELSQNNDKKWFELNRHRYNENVLEPAKAFVVVLGKALHAVRPEINAIPKTDKSIFRIHRDVRFSPDKSPYKTHMGLFFWEGERKKMECPGLYFHVAPTECFVGVGLYMFPPDLLKRYREVVARPKKAAELHEIVAKLRSNGIDVGTKHYKKTPRGFDGDYPHSEYLQYNGVFGMIHANDVAEIQGEKSIDFCLNGFMQMHDLHVWLVENL
jgi:uncharacterized protein (TIGR02453 family)